MLRHTVTRYYEDSPLLKAAHIPRTRCIFPRLNTREIRKRIRPGERRGNAINCSRLSNCNYVASPGSRLHVDVSSQNKGNWAATRSMNAPVTLTRLFKQVARGTIKPYSICENCLYLFKYFIWRYLRPTSCLNHKVSFYISQRYNYFASTSDLCTYC